MSQPGMGAMLGYLGGNADSVAVFNESIGKTIAGLRIDDGAGSDRYDGATCVRFFFTDGTIMELADTAQSCCEQRYLHTDDDLDPFIGAKLIDVDIEYIDAPDDEDDAYGECHEQAFMKVNTSNGTFTVVAHNLHNGYYGGFCIRARKGTV